MGVGMPREAESKGPHSGIMPSAGGPRSGVPCAEPQGVEDRPACAGYAGSCEALPHEPRHPSRHRAGIPGGLSEGFRRSRCTPRDHCGQVASAGRWIAAHLVRARRAVPASSEFPATARPPRTRPRCDPTGAVTRRRAAGGLTEPAQHQISHRPAPSDGNAGLSQ